MARPMWSDFGSVWKTVREVDAGVVRAEAERHLGIACVGDRAALAHLERLLREGPDRYATPPGVLAPVPLERVGEHAAGIAAADLLIVALETGAALSAAEATGLERLVSVPRPPQILVAFGKTGDPLPPWLEGLGGAAAVLVDPDAPGAAGLVVGAMLEALPAGLHLAAARRLPALRPAVARRLTAEVSLSNATVAAASGLPSFVIALGVPVAAGSTLVLTKNQALLAYRLALAHGAPTDFKRRMAELTPVIGAAVMWRQVAGGLVGLIPGYGILPKTAVAYAGTFITGRAAALWYQKGAVSKADLRRISAEATAKARTVAARVAARRPPRGGD